MINFSYSQNITDVATLHEKLRQFNVEKLGYYDPKPLTVVAKDEHDNVVGGLTGLTYWNYLSVEVFFMEAAMRGQGHGKQILFLAEEEARRRGCNRAFLDTFDFQALDFYISQGYGVFGRLGGFAGSKERYFLKKELKQP